jgi:hypothetical protein
MLLSVFLKHVDTLGKVGGSGIGADAGEEEVMNVEELRFHMFASTTSNSQVDLLNSS